ncbi:MAG UNVERIFIED_CONTAM: ATP-binding protein [Anaerolineae bacterium]|jgi:predicted HTH transcriptional regulator
MFRLHAEEGVSIIQSFHVSAQRQGGHLYNILVDVCAFANTNGGTIYIGLEADSTKPIVGVQNAQKVVNELSQAIDRSLSPS